jgi:hypothetical protein
MNCYPTKAKTLIAVSGRLVPSQSRNAWLTIVWISSTLHCKVHVGVK